MAVVITDNITTYHDLNSAPTIENLGSTNQGAQGISGGIEGTGAGNTQYGRRIDNTNRGFCIDNGSGIDMSAAGTLIGIWVNCLWPSFIQEGTRPLELVIASNATLASNYFGWSMFESSTSGTKPYPPAGGYQRVWVAVNEISPTKDIGTDPTMSSIRNIGIWVSVGDVPGTAATVFVDNITYLDGGGIFLDVTTNSGSVADFSEFVAYDWDDVAVRQGVVIDRSGTIECYGRLGIGDQGLCDFDSSDEKIVFADQRGLVNSDTMGITVSLGNASTDVTWTRLTVDSAGAEQGDIVVTGTSGVLSAASCNFSNQRVIELTTACTMTDCSFVACGQISGHANLAGSSVLVSTAASALLWNLNSDPSGELDDMTFQSDGSSHAIELGANTPATITLSGHSYSDYAGTDGSTGNEVIYNNSAKAITINVVDGGDIPTIRNGASASTTVQQSVTITVNVIDESGTAVGTAQVAVYDGATELMNEDTTAGGVATEVVAYTTDVAVTLRVRKSSTGTRYVPHQSTQTITSAGLTVTVTLIVDGVAA